MASEWGLATTSAPTAAAGERVHRGIGFESMEEELRVDRLPVSGDLPEWLDGTLVRVTPALLDIGGRPIRHWFDGLAMLNAFTLGGGRVAYASRFLDSEAYREARKGHLNYLAFGSDPCRKLFKRLATLFHASANDNCNVNLTRLGERYVAMTESPLPLEFDPVRLETLGLRRFSDGVGGHVTSAHPHYDPERDELVNYVTHFGPRSSYRVFALPSGAQERRPIASVDVSEPAYMHSFAMTERYVVLVEFPLVVDPLRLVASDRPFIHSFRWHPERGTWFQVIDRHSGRLAGRFESEPFFAFHHVNAFERGEELVLDVVAYDDPSIISLLEVERLRGVTQICPGELRRYTIPADGGPVSSTSLADTRMELPRINYSHSNTRDYRFVYAAAMADSASDWFDALVKVSVPGGPTTTWQEPGCYPGEPVFIPAPGGCDEDAGVVASVVLDAGARRSFLLLLDAATFDELARAIVPHRIPFGFHGQYFREAG